MLTSGLHQPPIIATAARVVAEQIATKEERKSFLKDIFYPLVRDHQWLLRDRDPNHDGVVTILHPWESGMDNSPSMLVGIRPKQLEKYIGRLITPLRFDVKEGMDASLRTSPENSIALAGLVYRLRMKKYDSQKILADNQASYAIDSVLMNHVLLKATKDLAWIGKQIGSDLPADLQDYLKSSRDVVERFWDKEDQRFYDIDATTGKHIKIPTISNILPLINHEGLTESQGNSITALITDPSEFAGSYGVSTVSQKSPRFNHLAYWSGPMWPWMNRYLFHGANEAGETAIAKSLRRAVIEAVGRHGAYEHYSPLTGEPSGAKGFSPTAGSYLELDSCEIN